MRRVFILGTPLEITDYESCFRDCLAAARRSTPVAVEFANTQVVTMRRHEPDFHRLSEVIDRFVPDATPLVWLMNLAGATMRDRVYGPAFMRHCLVHSPPEVSHYFIGGSEACGARLREIFQGLNPQLRIAGSFHERCGADGSFGNADAALLDELDRCSPDFIWVGLGTPKQQAWIHCHKRRLRRGVLLSIGQAFDVNAGLRPDAPAWMQRAGITWLYRMFAEPRRLVPRYLRYNSLFLFYLLWDGMRGRALRREGQPTVHRQGAS